jgi:glycosyltransferase involved in cell wall biosynthesis
MGRWAEKKAYKNHIEKKIAKTINSQKSPTVFGNNSPFMYRLTPFLAPHVRVVDLTHNFSDFKEGAEWYSLPYVPRLDKRIVVGNQLIDQFRALYKANNIPERYLDRIVVIKNKIAVNDSLPKKNYTGKLQVLFVARNSPEKRVNVLIKIAELCDRMNLPIEFKMIGNFNDLKTSILANTSIIGTIHDKKTLNNHYKTAHLLLLTSYREGLPLVIFEAMSFGAVPISTNVGDLSNYISNEKRNGSLIDNLEDEDKLAELFVKEILDFHNNRNKLTEFSLNAFETIKERFNEAEFSTAYKKAVFGETKIKQ